MRQFLSIRGLTMPQWLSPIYSVSFGSLLFNSSIKPHKGLTVIKKLLAFFYKDKLYKGMI